ncbi:MAG: hypothetical protein JKY11_06015 [Alphaproteobacteria bacterium]|nr:hypothetical protein [Alphaproteobacteria bacterium]
MNKDLTISKQELCELFQQTELLTNRDAMYKSSLSVKPLSLPWNMVRGACVQLTKDAYDDLTIHVLNQATPIYAGAKWSSVKKDLRISLMKDKPADGESEEGYHVDSAVAFRHGYSANDNPKTVQLIFNTAVECIHDLVERNQTRYDTDRFKTLKMDLENLA